MATPTYDPIASTTLTSSASSVTFSSIPQNYRDLIIVVSAAITAGTGNLTMRLNSDSGSNYGGVSMEGTGSAAQSGSGSTWNQFYVNINNGSLWTTKSIDLIQIMDYSVTDKHKSILARGNGLGTGNSVGANAGRWANTSAVTTVQLLAGGATLASGSTFSLYGIAA